MSTQNKKTSSKMNFQSLLKVIQEAPDIKTIKSILSKHILDIFQVELAAIFLVKENNQELVSWLLLPGDSLEEITVPIETNSIVGFVASKMRRIDLGNPYDFQELRRIGDGLSFSDSYDKKANVHSKQVLAIPIVQQKNLIGVFQLINTKDGNEFSVKAQKDANELAELLAYAFVGGDSDKQDQSKYNSLIAHKILSREQLKQGLAKAAQLGVAPETVLIADFKIPKKKIGKLIAQFYSTSFVDLEKVDCDPQKVLQGASVDFFESGELVPLSLSNGKLIVAGKNIEDQTLTSTILNFVSKAKQVELMFAFQDDIRSFWKRINAKKSSASTHVKEREQNSVDNLIYDMLSVGQAQQNVAEKRDRVVERVVEKKKETKYSGDTNDPLTVELVAKIIEQGCSSQATSIHIEPYGIDESGEVRYRIGNACSKPFRLTPQYVGKVVDRIRFMASLNGDERIKPQVGKINYKRSNGKEVELRVVTIPTANSNEDIVLSILPAKKTLVPLDKLMPSLLLSRFKEIIEQQLGLVLVVGPVSSGKTITLHSALAHLNTTARKIWTAEYPVEIQQRRIRQVQLNPVMNYNFADALRAFLGADADVIMIGELQDPQTAVMAVDAALNGHLLLSTLPVNSAAEGITHCLNMGINPTSLATALQGILAQRLIHSLCENCKEPYHPGKDEYDRLMVNYGVSFFEHINVAYSDDLVFYRSKGCPACNNSGYRGEVGLYELLFVTPSIRTLIMKRAPESEIINEAIVNNMTLLIQEGIQLIFEGTTDYKELRSACSL